MYSCNYRQVRNWPTADNLAVLFHRSKKPNKLAPASMTTRTASDNVIEISLNMRKFYNQNWAQIRQASKFFITHVASTIFAIYPAGAHSMSPSTPIGAIYIFGPYSLRYETIAFVNRRDKSPVRFQFQIRLHLSGLTRNPSLPVLTAYQALSTRQNPAKR